jgi:hypothetical protein
MIYKVRCDCAGSAACPKRRRKMAMGDETTQATDRHPSQSAFTGGSRLDGSATRESGLGLASGLHVVAAYPLVRPRVAPGHRAGGLDVRRNTRCLAL